MSTPIGIDVAKDTLEVLVMQQEGETRLEVTNNPKGYKALDQTLQRLGVQEGHVCLEATGTYYEGVADYLHQKGYRVSVVNPAWIKAYGRGQGRRNTTDRLAARVIADYCRTQQPVAWQPPSPELRELRSMARRYESLQKMRQQEINRLKSGAYQPSMQAQTQAHIAYLKEQLAGVERLIRTHLKAYRSLQRLCHLLTSIPGIGLKTAWRVVAEVPDLALFSSSKQLAAYAGLTPERLESGSSVWGPSHLTKLGNRRLRTALFFPALVAMRFHPFFAALAARHLALGQSKMSTVGILMHKLIRIIFGVLKSGRPFDLAALTA